MTPYHHHNHHNTNICHQIPSNNPHCYSSCCCSCNCNSYPSSPHPPPISLTTNLLKTQSFLKPKQLHSQNLLQHLIRRVSALETSLSQLTFSARTLPDPPLSIREVAARRIQMMFRRFLVRRSQTLRDLSCLAFIKSRVAALRLLVCGDGEADPEGISRDAMDLLLRLDSLQSSNTMIRDGKRSISRQLTRMLEFVDKVLVQDAAPQVPRTRSCKRVSFADNGRGIEEEGKEGFYRLLEDNEEVFEDGIGAFHGGNGGFELSAPQPLQWS